MTESMRKSGRGSGAGWTENAAAKRAGIPWRRWKEARRRGEINVVEFGGQVRVTEAEVQRIRSLFEMQPEADDENQAA